MSGTRSTDRRVGRTRLRLRDALLVLAEREDIATITIQEITDAADVGRATFYLHYRNKDELVAEVFDGLFDELTTASRSFVDAVAAPEPVLDRSVVVNLFELLETRRPLYRTLFRSSAGIGFADRLQAFHEAAFLRIWNESGQTALPGSPSVAFRARYVAGAVRGIMNLWLEQSDPALMESFGAWTQELTIYLLSMKTTPVTDMP